MTETSATTNVIDRLFGALERGDVAAAQACLTEDAVIWHGFDRIRHDRESVGKDWEQLVANFAQRRFVDVHRRPTPDGFVQQHVMSVRTATGILLAWPLCVVVTVRGDRIARIDEYIDRAGHFTPDDLESASSRSAPTGSMTS
ncbi:nuclear transport factor 2 family protein [Nocardia bovistercoris]|uniref:Nuclear transport factor 2 family protein n=1 Tax=Nocardia bovistercoris TaxID=2785916 RepID=A0A931IEH9_9NOCA|nr:nuclear transport factor 2 family protein [Nocardia bovistercoris]MBH0779741.1 nuclear transport factor 2 family protein [Nocardia bovistercoris]